MTLSSYRLQMPVTEVMVFPDGNGYYICPRCHITVEREFMAFCDRCGQHLEWKYYKKSQKNLSWTAQHNTHLNSFDAQRQRGPHLCAFLFDAYDLLSDKFCADREGGTAVPFRPPLYWVYSGVISSVSSLGVPIEEGDDLGAGTGASGLKVSAPVPEVMPFMAHHWTLSK